MTGPRNRGRRAASGCSGAPGSQCVTPADRATQAEAPATNGDPSPSHIPLPAWVPTDGVIGSRPDRQVLVVGHTPTGFALTLLLGDAGYDPVLVCSTDPPARSRVTALSPAAVEVLGSLGLGTHVTSRGRRVDQVTVRRPDADDGRDRRTTGSLTGDSGRAPPIVIQTPVLRRILGGRVPDHVAVGARRIESVVSGDGGVAVTFDDGVREWFDVVVDAGSASESIGQGDREMDSVPLVQFETTLDENADRRGIGETWRPTTVVQRFPVAAGDRPVLRITTSVTDGSIDEVRLPTGNDRSEVCRVPDSGAFERSRVRQVRLGERDTPRRWWGDGRIARCGPAAFPAVPATGIGPSLGITDALGLVYAVAQNGTAVPDAIASYTARRARRVTALRRAATGFDHQIRFSRTPPLGSVYSLRAVALEPYFGGVPGALREVGRE